LNDLFLLAGINVEMQAHDFLTVKVLFLVDFNLTPDTPDTVPLTEPSNWDWRIKIGFDVAYVF